MKKTWFYAAMAAVMLISLVAGQSYAQTGTSNEADSGKVEAQYAAPSWNIGWVDNSTSDDVGAYVSAAYNPATGQPYIAYYDAINGDLELASPAVPAGSGDCGTGNNWWCRPVDTTGDVGRYTSIDLWSGIQDAQPVWKLGIAYQDVTNQALKVAIWTETPSGGSWYMTSVFVAAQGSAGMYTSLKFDSTGSPKIVFQSSYLVANTLRLARMVTSGGNCGSEGSAGKWQCDSIDSGVGMGFYASLDIGPLNTLYMAYYDALNGDLRYAVYVGGGTGNCGPSSNYSCTTIDATGNVGLYTSITAPAFITDPVRIAYYDKTNGYVRYAFQTTAADCTAANWFCGDVEFIGAELSGAHGISMALDKRNAPVITYMSAAEDLAPTILKIARPASEVGLLIGNCGDTLPGYLFNYWQCAVLDNASYGQGNVSLGSYTSIAVSQHGQISVAYLETDDYSQTNSLKIAQTLPTFADVGWEYWAHDYIEAFHFAGITGGCATGPLRYCPNDPVTRAQMAVFILKAEYGGSHVPPAATGVFSDVPVNYWAAAWIEELADEGITSGCSAGKYCPNNPVTRAQMAVFILKAEHGSAYVPPAATGEFSDVPVSHWAAAWIEQLAAEGITTGCSTGKYCPLKAVTRAQMAVFIDKAFGYH